MQKYQCTPLGELFGKHNVQMFAFAMNVKNGAAFYFDCISAFGCNKIAFSSFIPNN